MVKDVTTTGSFDDICARVLASHIICEKGGSFIAVAVVLSRIQHCGRHRDAREEEKGYQHGFRI